MKKLFLILICILCGCGRTVYKDELDMAEWACKDNGGIIYINSQMESSIIESYVHCVDDEEFVLNDNLRRMYINHLTKKEGN